MARSSAVWGVDIGNCSLKALRCYFDKDTGKLVADAFDFIEYPKILTQPDSDPEELVREALQQFLSRNSIKGDKIAISVAGQNGLTRFIKLPPVEPKRIPNLVKYEAKQQIPFDLKDIIWGYQRLGGDDPSDFAMDLEIGLFAMKREQVYRSLEPFDAVKMPIDFVQLTPMALYNVAMFDLLDELPPADEYDPENPPEYTTILSMGTDATDLVITNGFKVWQRNIPIGGNHFTKALTTEMKLTFSKAEHLKKNANSSNDKKALFQAMRPIFSDFIDQVQRSLQFFMSLDRYAKIGKIIGLGNPMQLAGLRKYLEQQMGIPVSIADSYRNMNVSELDTNPLFKDNLPTFGVSYALCLVGLGKSALTTNLLPREIVHARIINSKKPWAVCAAALLMLSCSVSLGMYHYNYQTTLNPQFNQWENQAKTLSAHASDCETKKTTAVEEFNQMKTVGDDLLSNVDYRYQWLELLKAINSALPFDEVPAANASAKSEEEQPEIPINQRLEIHIENIDAQPITKLALWKQYVTKAGYLEEDKSAPKGGSDSEADSSSDENSAESADSTDTSAANAQDSEESKEASASSGSMGGTQNALPSISFKRNTDTWLVQITGYHYHNSLADSSLKSEGADFVKQTFLKQLREGSIKLPRSVMFDLQAKQKLAAQAAIDKARKKANAEGDEAVPAEGDQEDGTTRFEVYTAPGENNDDNLISYSMAELGIQFPVLINELGNIHEVEVDNLFAEPETVTPTTTNPMGGVGYAQPMPTTGQTTNPDGTIDDSNKTVTLNRFDFVIQFIWTPNTPFERESARQAKLKAQAVAAAEAKRKALEEAAAKKEEESSEEKSSEDE